MNEEKPSLFFCIMNDVVNTSSCGGNVVLKPNRASATRNGNSFTSHSHDHHSQVSQPQLRIAHVVDQLQPIINDTNHQRTSPLNTTNHAMLLPSNTSASASTLSCVAASVPPLSSELMIRRLAADDYSKGHVELMGELTDAGPVTQSEWTERYNGIAALSSVYHIYVIEDTTTHRLVGSATMMIELKFIHRISHIAHIEDVVVSKQTRGKNCGIRSVDMLNTRYPCRSTIALTASSPLSLVGFLTDLARSLGCYKVILDCPFNCTEHTSSCWIELTLLVSITVLFRRRRKRCVLQ